jgi:hypothetical protein
VEYFRLDAKGRQINTEAKLIAHSRFRTEPNKEQREASRRPPRQQQRTVVRQTAPTWTDGWSWREDSGYRSNWSNNSAGSGWWSGNNNQRSGRQNFW